MRKTETTIAKPTTTQLNKLPLKQIVLRVINLQFSLNILTATYDVKTASYAVCNNQITHNIFYTAVTRARKSLKIFWTLETQQKVLQQLKRDVSSKDVNIISSRRNQTRLNL